MGLKSLQQRKKKQELIICKSDKSDKLVAVGPGEYLEMGAAHIGNDCMLKPGEADSIQKVINEHTSAWIKILGVGKSWNHTKRFRETMLNKTAAIPNLSLLIKDHKPVKPGEIPKSRPVCASNESMNIHLSNLMSEILDPLADNCEGIETVSTEDLLSEVDQINSYLIKASNDPNCDKKLRQDIKQMVLIGADAVSLFPNLKKDQTAEVIAQEFLDSK